MRTREHGRLREILKEIERVFMHRRSYQLSAKDVESAVRAVVGDMQTAEFVEAVMMSRDVEVKGKNLEAGGILAAFILLKGDADEQRRSLVDALA